MAARRAAAAPSWAALAACSAFSSGPSGSAGGLRSKCSAMSASTRAFEWAGMTPAKDRPPFELLGTSWPLAGLPSPDRGVRAPLPLLRALNGTSARAADLSPSGDVVAAGERDDRAVL